MHKIGLSKRQINLIIFLFRRKVAPGIFLPFIKRLFNCNFRFIRSFIHSFIRSFIHSFTHSFTHSFIHLLIHLLIHSFAHSFICSFIHSVIHSIICSFIISVISLPVAPFTVLTNYLLINFLLCFFLHNCSHDIVNCNHFSSSNISDSYNSSPLTCIAVCYFLYDTLFK